MKKRSLPPDVRANRLHQPSYLSGTWRLAQLGLLPQPPTPTMTSITINAELAFTGRTGNYAYHQVPNRGFFGFTPNQNGALVATPEKAVVDLLWIHQSKDPTALGITDPSGILDLATLVKMAQKWGDQILVEKTRKIAQNLAEAQNRDAKAPVQVLVPPAA